MTRPAQAMPAVRARRPLRRSLGPVAGMLLLAPAVASFATYTVFPTVRALYLSFTDYHFGGSAPTHFVGLDNYVEAIKDPLVLQGLWKAAWFTLLFYVGGVLLPLGLAVFLDRIENERSLATYRVLMYIPAVIPGPLIFALWTWLYGPSTGLVNTVLVQWLGLFSQPPQWIGDPHLAIPSVAIMEWWWGLGQMTVFLWVGMQTIPRELYEAARIDGASEWRVTRHVMLPLLVPTIMTWVILKLSAFAAVVEMLVFGGSGTSLLTWARYAWEKAFTGSLDVSYAATVGWMGALAMMMASLVVYVGFRRLSR